MKVGQPGLHAELGGAVSQLRRFWYDTSLTDDPGRFDAIRGSIGVERLVLGSDTPRGPVGNVVDFIQTSPSLTPGEKTRILDFNGDSVLTR
ncbi:hypothetical protein [Nocardia sp. CA-119907]|uniref:hypothetical protein n=1 Tax=Nocardia sp. CA-119907 TaxID=3239973 RepID=UPI003D961045